MKTQTRVLAEIEKIAKKAKVDADIEMNWANTGRIFFRRGFKTVANMSFDFQTSHGTFAVSRGERKAEYHTACDHRAFVDYTSEAEFLRLFENIRSALKGGR